MRHIGKVCFSIFISLFSYSVVRGGLRYVTAIIGLCTVQGIMAEQVAGHRFIKGILIVTTAVILNCIL